MSFQLSHLLDGEHPLDLADREAEVEVRHILSADCADERNAGCSEWLQHPRRRCDDAHRELLRQPLKPR